MLQATAFEKENEYKAALETYLINTANRVFFLPSTLVE